MTWIALRNRANELGFELAFHVRPGDDGGLVPDFSGPAENGWLLVGNHEHVAGIWVRAVTESAQSRSRQWIAKMLAECDPFVETVGDYDADFFAAGFPARAAAQDPERGRMLA